jgi:RHH-type rel operon transcriptional repressor/antitoxin RelB
MKSTTFTVRIDMGVKKRLERLAKRTGRSRSFLAAEAINDYLEFNEWHYGECGHRNAIAGDGGTADGYLPRACWSKALSTASVMAAIPVSMVGFGTGANKGEWLPGSCGPSPSRAAATRSGS